MFATSIVEGASMDPTLEDGERVIFNKIVYFVNEPDVAKLSLSLVKLKIMLNVLLVNQMTLSSIKTIRFL